MMGSSAQQTPATRQSWSNVQPLPAQHSRLSLQREFTQQEYKQISYGLIPEAMEDKWFIFLEEEMLYFHRSWTGYCIYQLTLKKDGASYTVAEAFVNRDASQYSGSSDGYDEKLLTFLIDGLLLGQRAPFPMPAGVPAGIATGLYQHHLAGTGGRGEETPERMSIYGWLWQWLKWLIRG